jgi:Transposase DDE domain
MERTARELSEIIRSNFVMHPARVACLLQMIWALISSKRVQLWALAEAFGGAAQPESRVKRISRFLREQALAWDDVSRCIMALLAIPGPWTLVMDRTNWQFGKIERNYLVLAVVYHGNAIPLLVKDLSRAGNSDTADRITLMERFLVAFGKDKVFCLLADREFIGEEWLKWLLAANIPPCIRQRNNTQVRHKNGGKVAVSRLLRGLAIGECRTWQEKFHGTIWQMVGTRTATGEYLVLLAPPSLNVELLPLYRVRWTIECLFKNAKSSGFAWEETHLTHPERAEKLVALLAFAVALSVKEGAIQNALNPIPFRKTKAAPLCSLFLYGLRHLADSFRKSDASIDILTYLPKSVRW